MNGSMMDDMSDHEKRVLLAQALGLTIERSSSHPTHTDYLVYGPDGSYIGNIWMATAYTNFTDKILELSIRARRIEVTHDNT